ncbi:MAG: septum formation protein Maf [Clostridia bacterium]|nr:septum formation protein Maf [Clostridia bacterium]
MKLILASNSKQRQDLLNMLGFKYEILVSNVPEESNAQEPNQYVMDLSFIKANSVASKLNDPALILAADSIIYMDGHIFEKPKTKQEAFENMKKMKGKTTYAVTGVTIKDLYKNKEISFADTCEVIFKKEISDEDIWWYVNNEEHVLDRAGYSVAGKTSFFVDKIVGDFYTVVGLPLSMIHTKLHELGYNLSDFKLNEINS